jgi:tRNA threonylcarbamoyl adenosine modification protein YeaZ
LKILSIDTSSNICAVAILEDNKLLKEISENNGLTHSETLMPLIKILLSSQNLLLENFDLIVCDKGPGSFTGIRIGVATAKGFSDSLNINSTSISSLEALAYNVEENGVICSLIDAKNDNVYVGVFENINGNYILRRNFSCENIYDVLKELQIATYPINFVGDGSVIHKNLITDYLPNSNFAKNNDLSAYNLGLAGLAHFKNDQLDDLLPLYLRKPQAERMLEEKANGK